MKVNHKTPGIIYRHLLKYPRANRKGDIFIHETVPNCKDLKQVVLSLTVGEPVGLWDWLWSNGENHKI